MASHPRVYIDYRNAIDAPISKRVHYITTDAPMSNFNLKYANKIIELTSMNLIMKF